MGRSISLQWRPLFPDRFGEQVGRVLVSSPSPSLAGNARALSVTTQSFFDMPSEGRLAGRGNPLEFFGFADSARLFARIANTAEGRQFEWILVCLPAGKTYSEVPPGGSSFA